ncbi:MAG: hypothetical protein ACQESR_05830 [Planctomycetota bacterium]
MQTSIDIPQAFSVRVENEFYPIRHLLSRLNPKLIVTRIATGRHVNGGPTVLWGLVHLQGKRPSQKEVENALEAAGFDLANNVAVHASCLWGAES